MKGTFFNRPLEWSIETDGEAWSQGSTIRGTLKVKNHSTETLELEGAGVGLSFAEVKKVHARTEGAMKEEQRFAFPETSLAANGSLEHQFELMLPPNSPVTDKKGSYFLIYGSKKGENHLMLKVEPRALFGKVIGLLDTFHRFKLKEFKSAKTGIEYKLLPPTSRDMANLETLNLTLSYQQDQLQMNYEFLVRKLDTASVTTKVNKESVKIQKVLGPKDYSLGKEMINQDGILKSLESVLAEVKLKSVF